MGSIVANKRLAPVVLLLMIALYVYGVLSVGFIPSHIAEVVLPLDLMVGIPLGWYFLVVRTRGITPLAVIPVIWVGYGLSVLALGSADAGVLSVLLAVLVPVELGIAIWECRRIVRTFKMARAASDDPMEWFRQAMMLLVRKETLANMAAAELSVWYYGLFSWGKRPYARQGETIYSYHAAGGYMNMMIGLALAFPVEIVAMHLLLSQWSLIAALIATSLSVYAALWLAGDARARMLRPVAVGGDEVRIECGIQMGAVIPLSSVDSITMTDPAPDSRNGQGKLNYGTFYQANVWLAMKHPVRVRTLLGKKRVMVIGISLDDPQAFMVDVLARKASAREGFSS